ncbi:MAG: hypothetical protein JWM55_859 [Acidimicrobiaceae bacterium]|nr:hypothetical protein [Acidimicrobiaceae bacterium]
MALRLVTGVTPKTDAAHDTSQEIGKVISACRDLALSSDVSSSSGFSLATLTAPWTFRAANSSEALWIVTALSRCDRHVRLLAVRSTAREKGRPSLGGHAVSERRVVLSVARADGHLSVQHFLESDRLANHKVAVL